MKSKNSRPQAKFEIVYMEEARTFINSLPEKVQSKIDYNIGKSMFFIDDNVFKKLENTDIWEFRTLFAGIAYRIFAFWDKSQKTLVVATHGLIKKTQKSPYLVIDHDETIIKIYFEEKQNKIYFFETIHTRSNL